MNFDKLSALFKERDELKDVQYQINDDKFILVLYLQGSLGGHVSKVLEDNYKAILNTAINTKLLDIEYKIEEAFKESSV
jgi:hypothetical protein